MTAQSTFLTFTGLQMTAEATYGLKTVNTSATCSCYWVQPIGRGERNSTGAERASA